MLFCQIVGRDRRNLIGPCKSLRERVRPNCPYSMGHQERDVVTRPPSPFCVFGFLLSCVDYRKKCTVIVKIVDRKNVPVCQNPKKFQNFYGPTFFGGVFLC